MVDPGALTRPGFSMPGQPTVDRLRSIAYYDPRSEFTWFRVLSTHENTEFCGNFV